MKTIDHYEVRIDFTNGSFSEMNTIDLPNSFPPFVVFRKKNCEEVMITDKDISRVRSIPIYEDVTK